MLPSHMLQVILFNSKSDVLGQHIWVIIFLWKITRILISTVNCWLVGVFFRINAVKLYQYKHADMFRGQLCGRHKYCWSHLYGITPNWEGIGVHLNHHWLRNCLYSNNMFNYCCIHFYAMYSNSIGT